MTSRPTAVLAVLVVTLAVAVPVGAAAFTSPTDGVSPQVQEPDNQTTAPDDGPPANGTDAGNETAANETDDGNGITIDDANVSSFAVESVSIPTSVSPDDTFTAVAFVENPNAEATAQPVEFRLDGDVADRQRVAVAGESVAPVTFEVDASEFDLDSYTAGVYTAESATTQALTVSESFVVSELSAPETATAGDTATVTATVTNPNDFETTQQVTFRFGGVPLASQQVTLGAENATEFTAEADTTGVASGQYIHGVLTRDAGQIATITIEEPVQPAVTFENQSSDGTTVTVDSATLPEGGYVVIHDETLAGSANDSDGNASTPDPVGSVVGVSNYLEAGTTENVTVDLFDVPGADFDADELTEDATLTAMAHRETMGDRTLDFVRSAGEQDGPYTVDGDAVTDTATVTVDQPEAQPQATVTASDQSTDGTTVTVDSVNVSAGGFVAIHDASLLEGNVVGSVIGVSEYLQPGATENVSVDLFDVPGAEFDADELTENGTLIAMPHLDTDADTTYDFVATDGAADGAYTADGQPVIDTLNVTVTATDDANMSDNETEMPANDTDASDNGTDGMADNGTDASDNGTDGTTDGETSDESTDDSMTDDSTTDESTSEDDAGDESTSDSESTPTATPSS